MAFQVLLAANSIPILPSHPSREKLLAHRAGDSKLCMGNTESRHVVESSRAKIIIQTDHTAILDILN